MEIVDILSPSVYRRPHTRGAWRHRHWVGRSRGTKRRSCASAPVHRCVSAQWCPVVLPLRVDSLTGISAGARQVGALGRRGARYLFHDSQLAVDVRVFAPRVKVRAGPRVGWVRAGRAMRRKRHATLSQRRRPYRLPNIRAALSASARSPAWWRPAGSAWPGSAGKPGGQ